MVQEFDEVHIADGRRRLCSSARSLRRVSSAAMQRGVLTVSFCQDRVSGSSYTQFVSSPVGAALSVRW